MKRRLGMSMVLAVALCVGSGVSGSVGAAATGPPAAPGGTIAFSYGDQFPGGDLFAPSDVFTVRPDGSHLQQLTHAPADTNAALPDISKDGTKIVYEVGNPATGTYEIWTMELDGSNQTQITDEPGLLHLTPSWSPNGKQIVFSRCDLPFGFLGSCEIARHRRRRKPLRTSSEETSFTLDRGSRPTGAGSCSRATARAASSVWIVNRDGSHLRRVTAADTMAFWPDWSPRRSRITYSDNCCRPHSNLWSVRPDGSGRRRLTNAAPGHDSSFGSYGPSGQRHRVRQRRRVRRLLLQRPRHSPG